MTKLSLEQIQIVVFYYGANIDHPWLSQPNLQPRIQKTFEELRDFGLLKLFPPNEGQEGLKNPHYKITSRGESYVCALVRVPLPQAIWRTPIVDDDSEISIFESPIDPDDLK